MRAQATAERPLVSVIVPAWNAQATLLETLRSVAGQTYRNLEILIVDDGSTDRTAAIAEEFCAEEPRARLIRKDNGGVASARNAAITVAAGEWIAPIDADDLWHQTRIEKMLHAALAADPKPGLVYCWSRVIDHAGNVTGSLDRWSVSGPGFNQFSYLNVVGNASALLLSREALSETGGYDTTLRAKNAQGAEDLFVQIEVSYRHPVEVVPEHLVGWRRTGGNMSGDGEQMHRSGLLVFDHLAARGIAVPAKTVRRAAALSSFVLAEIHAGSGNVGPATHRLLHALRLDPLRCGTLLVNRIIRTIRGFLPGAHTPRHLPNFFEVDPKVEFRGDPHEIAFTARLIERLERSRLERLATRLP